MAISDMPNIPPQNVPALIAQANQAQSSTKLPEHAVGICQIISNGEGHTPDSENVIEPISTAQDYFYQYENKKTVAGLATIFILQQPKHGSLRLVSEADRGTIFDRTVAPLDPAIKMYAYIPEKGYFGKDSTIVLVDIGGIKVKVSYSFPSVDKHFSKDWEKEYCKKGYSWKISYTFDTKAKS
jgi:hypothetical protein